MVYINNKTNSEFYIQSQHDSNNSQDISLVVMNLVMHILVAGRRNYT